MPTERRAARLPPAWRALLGAAPGLPQALSGVLLFSAVASLLALVPALFSIQVYDRVLGSRSGATLVVLLAVTLLALGGGVALDAVRQRLLQQIAAALDDALAPRVAARLASGLPSGATAVADLGRLRTTVGGPGMAALFDLPWLPLVVLALALLHPWLGGLTLAGVLLTLGLQALQQTLLRPAHQSLAEQAQADQRALAQLPERASTWRLQGRLADGLREHAVRHQAWLAGQTRLQGASTGWSAGLRGLKQSLKSLLLACGAWLVIGGDITPGVMIGTTLLFGRLVGPLEALHHGSQALRETWPAAQRLAALLAEPAPAHAPAAPAAPGAPRLQVLNASLGWPGQPRPLLRELSAELAPGELLAVIGPAGVGKTCFARLLLGLQAPALGQVRVDGLAWAQREQDGTAPLRAWWGAGSLGAWDTLAEAVTGGGVPEPARLDQVAREAGLDDWVQALPGGWASPLGPGGVQPSTQQVLALSLARLLYSRPALAVFDEPGQLTDGDAVQRLRQAIAGLQAAGCTVLLLTGRASWAQLAPRWLLLSDGRLLADGPATQVARQLGVATGEAGGDAA